MSKAKKRGPLRRSRPASVSDKRGQAKHKSAHWYENAKSIDVYIWIRTPIGNHCAVARIRRAHLAEYIARTKGSRKSINNTTSVLSSLVKYAVKNRVIADPDLTFNINAQAASIDAVAPENVDLLAGAAKDPRYLFAVLAAADAGLRIGEIRALARLEVNELAREMTIAKSYDARNILSETKGWERRTVPMSQRLWDAYRAVPVRGRLVFSRLDGEALSYPAVRTVIHEIYVAAKVTPPKKPWHSLRHTFGTELANSGASIQTIRELMGHKSIETTMRYLHTTRDQKRSAIAGLKKLGSRWAADQNPGAK